MNSGCSAPKARASCASAAFAISSCHQRSRPSAMSTACSGRSMTSTCSTVWPGRSSAVSTASLSGKTRPLRFEPFAVMTSFAAASSTRWRIASAEKPPKITECTAPMRAQASIATTASGSIGR